MKHCWTLIALTACAGPDLSQTVQGLDSGPPTPVDAAALDDAEDLTDAEFCAAPPQPPPAPEKPGGVGQYDVTNDGQPYLMISGATEGATVKLYYDNNTTSYQSCEANSAGQCSIRVIQNMGQVWSNFTEGEHTFYATQKICVLESNKSPGRTIKFDYSVSASTIAWDKPNKIVKGTQADGDVTIQIWGRKLSYFEWPAGNLVFFGGGPPGYMGGSYTPDGTGGWSQMIINLIPFAGSGYYELAPRAQDVAGNVSWGGSLIGVPVPTPPPWPDAPSP
jgi:hypothetical protein